jgi:hypothetical protein
MIKVRSVNAYIAVSFIVPFFFWVIFFPGFYSGDSIGVLNMVQNGELGSGHTAPYALYVEFFTISGRFPGIVTLLNLLLLNLSISLFILQLNVSLKTKFITIVIASALPTVWTMGITFWHDIPFSAGFIFLLVSIAGKINRKSWVFISGFSGILISFRPNWIPLVLLSFVVLMIFKRTRTPDCFKPLIVSVLFASLCFFGGAKLINKPPIVKDLAQQWITSDLSCYAWTEPEKFQEKFSSRIGLVEKWSSRSACTFINDSPYLDIENETRFEDSNQAWFQLLIFDPIFLLRTHFERNSYLVPLPFFGVPQPPFLHTDIEFEGMGVQWSFPELANEMRNLPRAWNYLRGIFAYAGFWFLILFLLAYKEGALFGRVLLVLCTSLVISIFVFAPIPDARYALPVLILGQVFSVLKLVERIVSKA